MFLQFGLLNYRFQEFKSLFGWAFERSHFAWMRLMLDMLRNLTIFTIDAWQVRDAWPLPVHQLRSNIMVMEALMLFFSVSKRILVNDRIRVVTFCEFIRVQQSLFVRLWHFKQFGYCSWIVVCVEFKLPELFHRIQKQWILRRGKLQKLP